MPDHHKLLSILKLALSKRRHVSARSLVNLINAEFALDLSRSDINPILYRYRSVFERDGTAPPLWSLRPQVTERGLQGHGRISAEPELQLARESPQEELAGAVQVHSVASNSPNLPDNTANARLYRSPRAWQSKAIEAWKLNNGRGIVQAVTGTGKTFVATWILAKYINAGRRCLVVVPTITLLEQWRETLQLDLGLEITSLLGGTHGNRLDLSCPVTIGVVNSVATHADSIANAFGFLVADECHRYAGNSFRHSLLSSCPHRLGLTATLERSDEGVEEVLRPYFDGVCFEYNYANAHCDGVIAPYNVISLSVDLEPQEMQEYEQLGETMQSSSRQLVSRFGYPVDSFGAFMQRATQANANWNREGQLASAYLSSIQKRKKILSGTNAKLDAVPLLVEAAKVANKSIVFCETIESAEKICAEFCNQGVGTAVYHSRLSSVEREKILESYQDDGGDDQLDCLVAVRSLDEGIDIPRIDCGIIVATTRQQRQMIQRMGRVVRLKPDGTGAAVIVLYAKNTAEDPSSNGNPEDSHFEVLRETAEVYKDRSLATIETGELRTFVNEAIYLTHDNTIRSDQEETQQDELEEKDEEDYERYSEDLARLYLEMFDHWQRVPGFSVSCFLATESGWGRQQEDIQMLEKMELLCLLPGSGVEHDESQDCLGSMRVASVEPCFSPRHHILEYLYLLDW